MTYSSVELSVVVPVYNEEELILRLHRETAAALDSIGLPWEVVYVNDGSRDRSLELLLQVQANDPRAVVIDLSRNWGHQPALSAGIQEAKGEAVVLMDADLQDPPSVIPSLVHAWRAGADVVLAQRSSRKESPLRSLLFPAFYKVLSWLSDYPIPMNAGIFGLMSRRVVDAITQLPESNRYLPGLRAWIGYETKVVFYDRAARAGGEPKQTLLKLVSYALNSIFSFSYKPMRLGTILGAIVAISAVAFGILLLLCKVFRIGLFGEPVVAGYTSTIVSVLFLGGVQLISVGILGEYIGRIYDEVKRRPLYLIRELHRKTEARIGGPEHNSTKAELSNVSLAATGD